MGTRERVRGAIQRPVDDAEQELRELQDADPTTRLTVLIDGWARGLAAALEELAIALDDLGRRLPQPTGAEEAASEVEEPRVPSDDREEHLDLAGADEDKLAEEARRSRAATAELHEEGEEARRSLER
jgi:hypothetical protein